MLYSIVHNYGDKFLLSHFELGGERVTEPILETYAFVWEVLNHVRVATLRVNINNLYFFPPRAW